MYLRNKEFKSVKRFEEEKETLYIGKDPIPMTHIWIDPEEIILSLRRILKSFKNSSDAPKVIVNVYNNLLNIFKSKKVLSPRSMRYLPFGEGGFNRKQ